MRSEAEKPEDVLSRPLYDLFMRVERVPTAMHKCKTLYEAVRLSRRLSWSLPIKRLGAVSMWTTAALTQPGRSRRYMNTLISSDRDAELWITQIGAAVGVAMDQLDQLDARRKGPAKDRKRTFLQHKQAAIRSLEEVSEHLAAIKCAPRLQELAARPEYNSFVDMITEFSIDQHNRHQVQLMAATRQLEMEGVPENQRWAALINQGIFFEEDPIPSFDSLIRQAIKIVKEVDAPASDRHGVRGRFLRRLYEELEGTSIENVRVAFLSYASEKVFSEEVDKAQVRRLVKDVAEEKAAMYARLEAVGFTKDWFRTWGQKKGDISLQSKSSAKSLPVAASGPNNSKQSRSGSGHCEKTQNESACASPRRRSHRTAGNRKPASTEGSLQTHRKKSE